MCSYRHCNRCPRLGPLAVDVAYGGNFYAIIEPQGAYKGIDQLVRKYPFPQSLVRTLMRTAVEPVHPLDSTIRGVSHVMWTDKPKGRAPMDAMLCFTAIVQSTALLRDRHFRAVGALGSPGKAESGDQFVHESIIGSRFIVVSSRQ